MEVAFKRQEAVDGLTAGYNIQVSTARQGHLAVSEQFQVSGHLASGASHPLGYRLNLAQLRGIKGKDSIRLAQLGLLNNDGFCLIIPWLRHF